MAGISALASALGKPVGIVSKAIYQAPSVLMRGVDPQHRSELEKLCTTLGLDIDFQPSNVELPPDNARYDVAVHVEDAACIPAATEILARILGVAPDKAFRLLATPPGLIIGDVSIASADALARRFGRGCSVSASVSGEGPFDLFLPEDARIDRALDARCGGARGLIMLGLDKDEAREIFSRLPKGSARLIPRALLRFDLLLKRQDDLTPAARSWLIETAGCVEADLPLMLAHAPVVLIEATDYVSAATAQAAAAGAGLETEVEAHGFLRSHITVTEASDLATLKQTLDDAGLAMPARLPGRIAENLPDLDARWLAHKLEQAGASFLFEEAKA